jgi:hypothetical protein
MIIVDIPVIFIVSGIFYAWLHYRSSRSSGANSKS